MVVTVFTALIFKACCMFPVFESINCPPRTAKDCVYCYYQLGWAMRRIKCVTLTLNEGNQRTVDKKISFSI
ncbi:hypothetical protein B0T19DRAFT_408840 [Cercophora scortea]|uniref:Secreted protein n=1 Tax=Cercophora scortea TaxID=314031 RepID=A0AAE0MM72_9PEZI|nr:hypothetical protein B0T19DRAFT_408840 [Cercophora scortea]